MLNIIVVMIVYVMLHPEVYFYISDTTVVCFWERRSWTIYYTVKVLDTFINNIKLCISLVIIEKKIILEYSFQVVNILHLETIVPIGI